MKGTTHEKLPPGDCITEAERTAMLARLVEIAEAYAAGVITRERAQHEAAAVLAPLKRRVKRLARGARVGGRSRSD